jgi:hypothetical protein
MLTQFLPKLSDKRNGLPGTFLRLTTTFANRIAESSLMRATDNADHIDVIGRYETPAFGASCE